MSFFQQKYKFVWQHQLSEATHSEQKKLKHNARSVFWGNIAACDPILAHVNELRNWL
jgi:hypothetical protein